MSGTGVSAASDSGFSIRAACRSSSLSAIEVGQSSTQACAQIDL
jgi:hypothetical protein